MKTLVHEEQYRGAQLIEKMKSQALTICGAGAIGSNMTENLSRQGFSKISVIDYDRVDDHNRHTQVWSHRDVGQLKVNALQAYVYNIMGVKIIGINRTLDVSNVKKLLPKGSIVIDGFDNSSARRIVSEYCSEHDIECLHAGLYRDCAEVCWNDSYRIPDDVKGMDVCEYPLARNVIMMAVSVASESLIRFLDTGAKENYMITLKDLKIAPL